MFVLQLFPQSRPCYAADRKFMIRRDAAANTPAAPCQAIHACLNGGVPLAQRRSNRYDIASVSD